LAGTLGRVINRDQPTATRQGDLPAPASPKTGALQPSKGTTAGASDLPHGTLEGPWVNAFWVLTESRIRSKSNFRRSSRSEAWRANQDFENAMALALRAGRPLTWPAVETDLQMSERPVIIAVTFAKSTIDAGNHSKSVLDAAEGVVYVNDAQVAASCAVAERGLADPYLLVAFAELPAGSPVEEVASAASALLSAASATLTLHKG